MENSDMPPITYAHLKGLTGDRYLRPNVELYGHADLLRALVGINSCLIPSNVLPDYSRPLSARSRTI